MLVQEQNNTFLHKSKEIPETQFRIAASAKAFKILSDSLYTNKVRAIIRELSCNAYDAHVAVGNLNQKFIVQLPNGLEPTFRIRDFGTGLSKINIEEIYTTYFASTKTNSNDYVGCLGLGSKTPFCYVDNFQINSYIDGQKLMYAAFVNDDGMPSVSFIGETPTTEQNGLEISFPVQRKDFQLFITEAEFVFSTFKNVPEITGQTIEVKVLQKRFEGPDWFIPSVRNKMYHSSIIMGNVLYPLVFNEHFDDTKFNSLLQHSIHLELPIGSVEVAASRESLSLNKQTIKFIREKLIEISSSLISLISKKISDCPTEWEARIELKKFQDLFNKNTVIFYKGKKIDLDVPFRSPINSSFKKAIKYHNWKTHRKSVKNNHIFSFATEETTAFCFVDKDFKEREVFNWLRNINDKWDSLIFVKCEEDKKYINEICDCDKFKFHWTQCVGPKPPKGSKPPRIKKTTIDAYYADFNKSKFGTNLKKIDLSNSTDIFYYTDCRHKQPQKASLPTLFSALKIIANKKQLTIPGIYGLNLSQIKKVEKKSNWINVYSFLEKELAEYLDYQPFLDYISKSVFKDYILYSGKVWYGILICNTNNLIPIYNKIISQLPQNHKINNYIKKIEIFYREDKNLNNRDYEAIIKAVKSLSPIVYHSIINEEKSQKEAERIFLECIQERSNLIEEFPVLELFTEKNDCVSSNFIKKLF